jgi:adenosylhomocysteine nucleosidase
MKQMDMSRHEAPTPWPARMRPRRISEAMKILVTFAVQAEFAPWQKRRKFRQAPGDLPHFETQFGGAHVRAILTGMGQAHALEAARRALTDRPDICISTGLAGALRSGYRPGDVLAARLVSEVGEPVAVASHPELLTTAVDCGARQVERFATSRTLVSRAEDKMKLGRQAEAVEMESYTILAEAARHGVPAVAVRTVSDTVDFDLPYDFERARDVNGQIRVGSIVAQVMRHPSGLPALLAFARDCRLAARHLADFLDAYTGTLGDRLVPVEPGMVAAQ